MKANKILLGLALSLSALTACGGGQSEQSAQDSTAQPTASVVANPDSLPYRIAENYFERKHHKTRRAWIKKID